MSGTDVTSSEDRYDPARRTRSKIETLYSDAAEGYQDLWAPELLPLSRDLLSHLNLEGARHVLDGAAGVGNLLPELRSRAPEATIVGADLSLGMLRLGPRDFPRVVSDAAVLPFRDESFDVGILAFVLFHLFEPERGIAEMARVLKPGGSIGTITWGDENDPVAFEAWAEEMERHGAPPPDPDLVRFEAVDMPVKVQDMMAAYDLRHVRSWVGEYRATSTPDAFIAHRTQHGQSRQRCGGMNPEARDACIDAARARLERLNPEDFEEISEVVYVIGQKS